MIEYSQYSLIARIKTNLGHANFGEWVPHNFINIYQQVYLKRWRTIL